MFFISIFLSFQLKISCLHIGWRDYFSLREEGIFAEGAEAFSVPQGVGSGLLNKCIKSLEATVALEKFRTYFPKCSV